MGIKMAHARDGNGDEWIAETYTKGKGKEPLQCMHCSAQITHQSAHPRERDEKSILIPAYFRLMPGRHHAPGCKHAVEEEIGNIVKDSEDLFESIREGQYRLRLMMIKEALEGLKPTPRGANGDSGRRSGKTYERSRNKLPPYINSAKRVLQLRALCEGDEDVAEYLELVFDGNTIVSWPQFYFETERHLEAYQAILHNTVEHPIALHGTVKSIKPVPGVRGKYGPTNVLNLEKDKYRANPNDPNDGLGVEVSVWAKNADWFSGIQEGAEVVILGIWKAKAGASSPAVVSGRFPSYTTHKLSVNLVLMAQIARIPQR